MKIKKTLVAALLMVAAVSYGQNNNYIGQDYSVSPNVITTAVPFVSIAPDARGGSMGDCGVASETDVYSMNYNAAKYAFMEDKFSIGLGYSPWLQKLTKDMRLAYLAGAYKINDRSSVAATLRYFSCGEIEFRDNNNISQGKYSPNEWAIDATYSRMLGDYLSGAVAGRFIYSDLTQNQGDMARPGISVAADVAVFYKRPVEWFSSMDADFSWGAAITNIGSKISYSGISDRRDFIPTTLRAGANLKLELDEYNSLAFMVDFSKLMVPTPPVIARQENGSPILNPDGTYQILYGYDNNVSVVQGMIQSFYDAPGGFREELREVMFAVGAEYSYRDLFFFRLGFFHESQYKGNREFVSIGAGLKYTVFGFDVSYLIATRQYHPLANTLRFTLNLDFVSTNKNEIKQQNRFN
jgi:hypothetical protein